MKTRISRPTERGVYLTWSHYGTLHRVSTWPETRFERATDNGWVPYVPNPSSDVFAAGAVMIDKTKWNRYFEYLPSRESSFLKLFNPGRLLALAVISQCPALVDALQEVPALTAFLALHAELRGTTTSKWEEINAIFSRSGLFGLLEWLGLPASRDTLAILQKIANPDVPHRLLEPLRASLWEPEMVSLLLESAVLTETDLVGRCHALAA